MLLAVVAAPKKQRKGGPSDDTDDDDDDEGAAGGVSFKAAAHVPRGCELAALLASGAAQHEWYAVPVSNIATAQRATLALHDLAAAARAGTSLASQPLLRLVLNNAGARPPPLPCALDLGAWEAGQLAAALRRYGQQRSLDPSQAAVLEQVTPVQRLSPSSQPSHPSPTRTRPHATLSALHLPLPMAPALIGGQPALAPAPRGLRSGLRRGGAGAGPARNG